MKKFFATCAMFAGISGAHASVINHDAVQTINESNPSNVSQLTAQDFKPYLKVYNGCVPFPSVDQAGNVGGGLKTTGPSNGGCSSSRGQIYARSTWYRGVWAIMYAWYFPKDEPSPGIGHRHDWESVVVWVNNPAVAHPTLLAVSPSEHGGYLKYSANQMRAWPGYLYGDHPLIGYQSVWPLDHSLDRASDRGGQQPLINWEQLSTAAQWTLNNYNYGSANVPFNDHNFWNNLAKAWFK